VNLGPGKDAHFNDREWRLLAAQGRPGRDRRSAAWVLAEETMARVAGNLELIIPFLKSANYHFGLEPGVSTTDNEIWRQPTPAMRSAASELSRIAGPLPLALEVWWQVVGSVSLIGYFPGLESADAIPYADPLVIFGPEEVLEDLEPEQRRRWPKRRDLLLDLAPDIFHKANVSGGQPYQVAIPADVLDPLMLNVRVLTPAPPQHFSPWIELESGETLIEYLRRSLAWAGFPGLAFVPSGRSAALEDLLTRMLPF
jgi:hypothetical protein